jgi:predicted O-methyltransferase YrrM
MLLSRVRRLIRGTKPLALPAVRVDEITSSQTAVILPEPEARDGNVSLLELVVLARLVRDRAPARIFEVGTFDGRTTVTLAANAPAGTVVHTLDLPAGAPTAYALRPTERAFVDKAESGARLRGHDAAASVHQLYGDSATFDFSAHHAEFVFVDGSHAYAYVRNDSERALQLTAATARGRGTIVWHDYGAWDGVTRGLEELHRSDARFAGLRHVAGTTLVLLDGTTP